MSYEIPPDIYPDTTKRAPDAVSPLRLPQNRFVVQEAVLGLKANEKYGGGHLSPEDLVKAHDAEVRVRGAGHALVELVNREAAEYVGNNQGYYYGMAKADMEHELEQRKAA